MNILLLLVVITAGPKSATVMGTVTNELDSSAIADAVVVLWGSHAEDSAITDSLGFYSLRLASGRHSLRASHQDYVPAVRGFAVDSGQRLLVDLRIHPKPIEMPSREVISTKKPLVNTANTAHNDSILASLAGIKIRELKGLDNYRPLKPEQVAFNNSVKVDAWKTYVSGRGTYGIRKMSSTVEGDAIYGYLLVENGRCRTVVDTREDHWGPKVVGERRIPRLLLAQGRHLAMDSMHYVAIPFSDSLPTNAELRFEFLDDAGYIAGEDF